MPIVVSKEIKGVFPYPLHLKWLENKFHDKFSSETRLWQVGEKPEVTGIYRCVHCWHEAYLEKDNHTPPERVPDAEPCRCKKNTARMLVVGLDEEENVFFCLKNDEIFLENKKIASVKVKAGALFPYSGVYINTRTKSQKFFEAKDPFEICTFEKSYPPPILPISGPSMFNIANIEASNPEHWELLIATNAEKNGGLNPVFANAGLGFINLQIPPLTVR
jgi:hypothetical protein